jgi:hypothetical protein
MEMAECDVREGERRIQRQEALLRALDHDTFTDEAAMTERLLRQFRDNLALSRAHLGQLQNEPPA